MQINLPFGAVCVLVSIKLFQEFGLWLVFGPFGIQEEMMRGKSGYEHLDEPLHILLEAELPVEIIDARLIQARDVLLDLLQPVVMSLPFGCRHVFLMIYDYTAFTE